MIHLLKETEISTIHISSTPGCTNATSKISSAVRSSADGDSFYGIILHTHTYTQITPKSIQSFKVFSSCGADFISGPKLTGLEMFVKDTLIF